MDRGRTISGRTIWLAAAILFAVALLLLVLLGRDGDGGSGDLAAGIPAAQGSGPDEATPPPADATPSPQPASSSLPHTDLPLRLVATVVREDPALSLATVEDLDRTSHQVIAEGQAFHGHPRARLERIERRRLILDNDGVREQLVIDPSDRAPLASYAPTPEELAYRRDLAARLREITDAGTDYLDRGQRGGLLREGDVSAVYEEGELIGVRVEAVREGGVYDRFGIRNGDVITSINGIDLGSPTAAADVLTDLALSSELEVAIERGEGGDELLTVPTEELSELLSELE